MKRTERWVAVGDTHGDMIDPEALSFFREFMDEWRPQHRIHGGDAWDFRWLRRGASDAEKSEDCESDVEAGCEFMGWFKPTVFLWGNHDDRLRRAIEEGTGAVRNYASLINDRIADVLGSECVTVPYDKRKGVYRFGDWSMLHGYACGKYATHKHAAVYGNCLHFHVHAITRVHSERLDGAIGRSPGCLCRLDMGYNASHMATLRQEHGFVYGTVEDDGTLTMYQAERVGGRWVTPGL